MRINNKIKSLFKNQYFIILILVFSIFVTIAVYRTFSVDTTSNIWDGTLSLNFSLGNGTESNPFEINSANDFAYLLDRLNSDEKNLYKDKYYEVNTSLDFGTFDITSASNFNGTIDFKGHALLNGKLASGLFTNLNGATIKNLRLYNVNLNNNVDAGLLANNINGSIIDNVIIHSNFTGTSKSSGLANSITNTTINNVIIYGNSVSNTANYYNIGNQLSNVTSTKLYKDNNYNNSSNSITVNDLSSINLNDYNGNNTYYVVVIDGVYYFDIDEVIHTSGVPHDISSAHATGLENNTIYINDYINDYYYLKGLNYTEVRGRTLPSTDSTGYYDDDNLVKVELIYDGADLNNPSIVGAVSPIGSENTNKYVYYKYYGLERNSNGTLATNSNGQHYIKVELIDNPFSKRPYVNGIEYAFNGWVCNQNADTTSGLCNNTKMHFLKDNYTRYMEVAVNGGSEITIHLNVNWYIADVVTESSDINQFNQMSMQDTTYIVNDVITEYGYARWRQGYYTLQQTGTVNNNSYLTRYTYYKTSQNSTNIRYVNRNNTRCNAGAGNVCYIYTFVNNGVQANSLYNGGTVEIVPNYRANANNTSVFVTDFDDDYMNFTPDPNGPFAKETLVPHTYSFLTEGINTAGFFYRVNNPNQTMLNTGEYYTSNGTLCTAPNSCTTAYKLIQYNDSTNNTRGHSIATIELNNGTVVDQDRYFYLVTRDTNIFRHTGNALNITELAKDRPYTVTGCAVNGNTAAGILSIANSLTISNDLVIENIRFTGSTNSTTTEFNNLSNTAGNSIFAANKNLKIGRNVVSQNGATNMAANIIYGHSANSSATTNFRVIVESGHYSAVSGSSSNSQTFNETIIIGNDYDRAIDDHDNLVLKVGYIGATVSGNFIAGNSSPFVIFANVKSGHIGYSYSGNNLNPTVSLEAGCYVNGKRKYFQDPVGVKVEGAIVNVIYGGSGFTGTATNNGVYIGMSTGSINQIYGGSTQTAVGGNRIINVAGGRVNGSVLGGSNSSSSSTGGEITASSIVYVGGTAVIGSNNNPLGDVTPGSVYGGGGGRNGGTSGSVYNTHVIINGGTVQGSVYGGGNFGGTGISHNDNNASHSSVVEILDGTVLGGVYGGAKSSGFGYSETQAAHNNIRVDVYGGTLNSVYGGSETTGTVYGSVQVNVYGGNIANNVYGGGEGQNTYISRSVDVIIGSTSDNIEPLITGNVYGGSAFGTVNGSNHSGTLSTYSTNLTINDGVIKGSAFGGGEGSNSLSPYVLGNINVRQNGGSVGNIYGSCDLAGTVNGNANVSLYGGDVGNVFGAGNRVGANNTNVLLQGGNANYIYGGANLAGNVTNSVVNINSGNAYTIYGGNNLGGTVTSSTITTTGGSITENIFGGGNQASITNTTVNINGINQINNVYGGSNEANATLPIVNISSGNINNVYGGSNISGTVNNTQVNITGGVIGRLFGGNNLGGSVTTTNVTLNGGNVTSVYGGGNQVGTTTTNINALKGSINKLCGGSYSQGSVNTANITVNGSHNVANGLSITYTLSNVRAVTYESNDYETYADVSVTVKNNSNRTINTWEGSMYLPDSTIYSNYSDIIVNYENNTFRFDQTNRWNEANPLILTAGASKTFQFSILTNMSSNNIAFETAAYTSEITENGIKINNLFGGNDLGGSTNNATITVTDGYVGNLYGGGNFAPVTNPSVTINNGRFNTIFGGGNNAEILGNTIIDINGGIINKNVYGGGNYGAVSGTATTNITDATVSGSAYAGGNGTAAVVLNTTMITIDGDSVIGNEDETDLVKVSLFGSGNAAATGDGTINNVKSIVNIAGGTVYGNVYGGANTSKTFGSAEVNIGLDTIANTNGLRKDDIKVYGTIFGGGEANASGSEMYDWSFISVTEGINININGNGYTNFDISGSIFGSGDASSASGTSNIYIYNYGTVSSVKHNISIQRADNVILDNSYIDLHGAKDSENNYSEYIFSLSRINNLTLKNNTYLFLQNSGLLVKTFNSLDSNNVKASVVIDSNGDRTQTVDNRLYMLEGNFLNVALDADATQFGEVNGMTFLGMYKINESGTVSMGIYGPSFVNGSMIDYNGIYTKGTYVVGLHKAAHNIQVDGYYSNFFDKDTGINKVGYVVPTEPSETVYVWSIGEVVKEYNVDLVASKYSTLGTKEVTFMDFSKPNTSYQIIGFDTSRLNDGIQLINKNNIPRIAANADDANNIYGLTVESSNSGWLTSGRTTFMTSDPKISGTTYYQGENSSTIHSLLFNLYHSKNITLEDGVLGTATIVVQTYHKVSPIEFELEKFIVNVHLFTQIYNTVEYEGAMTPGDKYEIFTSTATNINDTSKLSAYYALYDASNLYKTGYHRVLTSSNPLPVNTKLTLIDFGENNAQYYYYIIDQNDYNASLTEFRLENEVSYPLSRFRRMDTVNGSTLYNDAVMNGIYYNGGESSEEFIVHVDFEDTTDNQSIMNNKLLIEIRDSNEETKFSVLGIEHDYLTFNRYADKDAAIGITGSIEDNPLYNGHMTNLDLNITYSNQLIGSAVIFDTQYFDSKLGIEIVLKDSDDEVVSGTAINGISYIINGNHYYPNLSGSTRIRVADKVGNIGLYLGMDLTYTKIPTGDYKLEITSFGSPDGIYYGDKVGDTVVIPVHIINSTYGLKSTLDDKSVIIDGATGTNLDGTNLIKFNIHYSSTLTNPSIHMALYRREYVEIYDTNYQLVDLRNYIDQNLFSTSREKEYLVVNNPSGDFQLSLFLKNGLLSGTYRLDIMLCENDVVIGKVSNYIIIK